MLALVAATGAGIVVLRDGARRLLLWAGIDGGREDVGGRQVPDVAGIGGGRRGLRPSRASRGRRVGVGGEDEARGARRHGEVRGLRRVVDWDRGRGEAEALPGRKVRVAGEARDGGRSESSPTAGRGGKSGSGDAVKSKGAGGRESGATAGNAAMSPGTRMPGPGSGSSALFATIGSGPIVRSGSGAGAQGGPAGLAAAWRLGGFGAGVMIGRYGAPEECAISPTLPPCQPPAAGQSPAAAAPVVAGPAGASPAEASPTGAASPVAASSPVSPPSPAADLAGLGPVS